MAVNSPLARRAAPFILAAVVFACYAPSSRYEFVYDDHPLILASPVVESVPALLRQWGSRWVERDPNEEQLPHYRPLARLTYDLQRFVHGANPAPFHLFNALAIAGLVWLVYVLLCHPALGVAPGAALFGAALVGLHPAASSCVYSIAGRETLLAAGFAVAALYAYLQGGCFGRLWALLFYAGALFCKEVAVLLPGVFIAADALGLSIDRHARGARTLLRRHGPFIATALCYVALRTALYAGSDRHEIALFERPGGPLLTLLFTLQTAFLPFRDLFYEPRAEVWVSAFRSLASLAAVAGLALVTVRCEPRAGRVVSLFCVWIALTLLPVANVLDQETRFAERYAFLPILGGAAILATLGSALGRSRTLRRGLAVAGVVMVAGLGAISVGRGAYFRDDLAFHLRWADVNGHDSRSFFNLGVAFTERRMLKRGMDAYRHTLALDPENGGALNNLAWLLATAVDDELRDGKKAVELAGMLARSDGGQDLLVLDTLAAAYAEDGAFEAAVETASRAVALARAIGDRQLTREMQHRLKLYERKVPYRDR